MLALSDGLSDGGFARGYVQLQIDSANLRAAVRTRRMAKDADFLKTALIPGGTIGTDRVLAAFDSAEALTALYGNTWLGNAAAAGAAAMSGGALTAFELLCDNALMDYIRAAKLRSFRRGACVRLSRRHGKRDYGRQNDPDGQTRRASARGHPGKAA